MRIANPTGSFGEDTACEFLRKKGYKIIDRNFRQSYAEIDIIATHKKTLVFVEVKSRTSSAFGTPFESIAPWKLKHLVRLAQFYKLLHPELPDQMRMDAIGVDLDHNLSIKRIEHIENISGF